MRIFALAIYASGVLLLGGADVVAWVRFGIESSLYSYILLIPLVSVYLLRDRALRAAPAQPVPRENLWLILAGAAAALGTLASGVCAAEPHGVDRVRLALLVLALWVPGLLRWGAPGFRRRLFPMLFLLLAIPAPPAFEQGLNAMLQHASGWMAYHLIRLSGTPVVREGPLLLLPGLELEVAAECSGIRSTLVLLVTSALGAYLFLRMASARALLVAAVLPLGILRNGLRIAVLAWVTLYVDPEALSGPLHRRGGPLFFALSLLVWWWVLVGLRRWERRGKEKVP